MATTYFWQDELAAGQVRLGLTEDAQETLGKIKFVDLPQVGTSLTVGKPFLSVEAEKAVLDLEAPLAGTVVDVHQELGDKPALLDETDHNHNWVVTVSTK
ncbi:MULTISPECIES: glycine cleavage system protein H [Lacticaseibacillus]|uniref:Glycine cleavage system protein H n=3 Tax=Lacticaseibacillus zeae TaxID=57037 RepID=A0A5R8LKP6_LACZE|nr:MULTISPECIES: glycine cleavage system protein H [Lacticaseibacillus]OFR95101.1 glycine cleavage system protein H [Lactobacillus sp. HMSC068F07]KLI76261.1 glycine cleavage system protein H [Lacticaseibacillus casei]KRK12551.1 glycine cleavage system H protein [Lacticaseibacillus zeae DSM 20178 = KCTC 3804]MDE3314932.1 glycine cleavage system protein H [Lacticaseibacillus zeae]OLS10108.1 glycine cleavage system protein H [Lacticaseibacillus casei]